ncbi:uncharacterized protein CCR75_008534 [Bremia lactucae]|uniref:Uncharacterized protein n=1 Tax=Bremia lactucae TaxID=4779 RepID=A0A976FQR4_BRELC|nr:hypothetical protein CCR75_008534 [Bremia lactucae]
MNENANATYRRNQHEIPRVVIRRSKVEGDIFHRSEGMGPRQKKSDTISTEKLESQCCDQKTRAVESAELI